MTNTAIGFLTRDKNELAERSIAPLLQPDKFDLFLFDGSQTEAGKALPFNYKTTQTLHNIVGGPDAAVVQALTTMLHHPNGYQYVGLCECDVVLHPDWFGPTMALFPRGGTDGLRVGAVSARCYDDRILCQRDGYALMHNLGWGQVIFSRPAAFLTLNHMRTGWTTENRRVFAQLTGKDIGRWWAFKNHEHWTCADWSNDKMLAAHGFASLAVSPSLADMIGQTPPLHEQGLHLNAESVELLRDDKAFKLFAERTAMIRDGYLTVAYNRFFQEGTGAWIHFAHQLRSLKAKWEGVWELDWSMGFGPFGYKAVENSALELYVAGPCEFYVQGPLKGHGKVRAYDTESGYEASPMLGNTITGVNIPSTVSYRKVRLEILTPGVVVRALRTAEKQPYDPTVAFDASSLPPVMAGSGPVELFLDSAHVKEAAE